MIQPEGESLTEYEDAVKRAAKVAAQEVAAIHRKRLVFQTGIVSFVVAGLIGIIIAVWTHSSENNTRRADAIYNCHLFTEVAHQTSEFVRTDAIDRRRQLTSSQKKSVIDEFSKLIKKLDIKSINDKQEKLDSKTINYWENSIVPKLKSLAKENCEAEIQ